MMRGVFYCQHLLGIGHLTRSLAICHGLTELGPVGFIQGGPDIGRQIDHTNFIRGPISPLMMDERTSQLYSTEGLSLEEAFQRRSEQIEKFICKFGQIDYAVVELFPFGRRKFHKEIFHMLEVIKSKNSSCQIFTSVRDILVVKPDQSERDKRVAEWVNQYFDGVFVHSDENLLRLEDSFTQVDALEKPIYYTGFVCDQTPVAPSPREPRIVVTFGGGIVGEELVDAIVSISDELSNFEILIPTGPNTPEEAKKRWLQATETRANICLSPFLTDFEKVLAKSQLSISLAGYNTVMNILKTKTPALMLPYMANNEQLTRARALEKLNYIDLLTPQQLEPETLLLKINNRLKTPPPPHSPNLSGVESTRNTIESLVKKRAY